MYLNYDKAATEKLRARMVKRGGTMRFWKIVKWHECPRELRTTFLGAPVAPGGFRSDRSRRRLTHNEKASHVIAQGIHVFCRRKDAAMRARYYAPGRVLLCVTADVKRLVAAGTFSAADLPNAVFMRVHITRRSYAAALREAQK